MKIHVRLLLVGLSASTGALRTANAACTPNATAVDPARSRAGRGCHFGACGANGACAYDASFCPESGDGFLSAAALRAATGRVCTCADLAGYPHLIGVCYTRGVRSPMLAAGDCPGGFPQCPAADAAGRYAIGDPDHPFTACDLPCFHAQGHAGAVPDATYGGCDVRAFAWAATVTGGTADTFAGNNAVATTLDGVSHVIVAGEASAGEVTFAGPFTQADAAGGAAAAVTLDVPADPTEASRPWDAGLVWVDADTGRPVRTLVIPGAGSTYTHALGVGGPDGTLLAVGGEHGGNGEADGLMTAPTARCTPQEFHDANTETICNDDGTTSLRTGNYSYRSWIAAVNAGDGTLLWLIHAPYLALTDQQILDGVTIAENSILGLQVGSDGSVYATGYKELTDASEVVASTGVVMKLDGATGAEVWRREYPELAYAIKADLDEADGALYVAAEMHPGAAAGALGAACANPAGGGCSALVRLSAADGARAWTRTADGARQRPWESSEVHLAHADDGPYVYAAFQSVGVHGPAPLDAGSPYAGCRREDGAVVPEYDPMWVDAVLDPAGCAAAGWGTYFGRDSDFAIPAYAASTGATCLGHEAGASCLVKYHKHSGLPVWGAAKNRVNAFVPQADKITAIGTSGTVDFDSVSVLGALDGAEGRWGSNWISTVSLDGAGESVQTIRAYDSDAWGPTLVQDANADIFVSFSVGVTDRLHLGPGGPGSFEVQYAHDNNSTNRLTVAKLGDLYTPSCVQSCDGDDVQVAEDSCFVGRTCWEAGETAAYIKLPCQACDPSASQTSFSDHEVGTTFCFVEGVCHEAGAVRQVECIRGMCSASACQHCDVAHPTGWTLKEGWNVDELGTCTSTETREPAPAPVDALSPPTSSPAKPAVPVVDVPFAEAIEPPVADASPDTSTPAEASTPADAAGTPTDAATPDDVAAPADAKTLDADSSGNDLSRINVVQIVSVLVTVVLL